MRDLLLIMSWFDPLYSPWFAPVHPVKDMIQITGSANDSTSMVIVLYLRSSQSPSGKISE